jgi:translation initiation factor IF-2
VLRNGETLHEGRIDSLRRFQEDVREVAAGFECGLHIEGFDAYQEGDTIQVYHRERES